MAPKYVVAGGRLAFRLETRGFASKETGLPRKRLVFLHFPRLADPTPEYVPMLRLIFSKRNVPMLE